MEFQVLINDKDTDTYYMYQFSNRNLTVREILESYTIDSKRINYKGRYLYINDDGKAGTPLNDLDMNLIQYNLLHENTEIVYLCISSKSNLFEFVEAEPLSLAESLKL